MSSNIKLGSANTEGVYLKNKQLLYFDISKLHENIVVASDFNATEASASKVLIANLSNSRVHLRRESDSSVTTDIPALHVEWYNFGISGFSITNTLDKKFVYYVILRPNINNATNNSIDFLYGRAYPNDTILSNHPAIYRPFTVIIFNDTINK